MQCKIQCISIHEKGDVRQSFPCNAACCWNHRISLRATGPCLTVVWTLKRGDNLISTHVNTAAGAKGKLWPYCVSVIPSCILWPQEWKIFKWLWCPGSCWTALMVRKHLSSAFLDAHLLVSLPLYPQRANYQNLFVRWCSPCLLCVQVLATCRAAFTQPALAPHALAGANTSAGLMVEQPRVEGVDSSFYLPISLWILLQYWQTDSQGLWADRSLLSAGYHFQLNPFI